MKKREKRTLVLAHLHLRRSAGAPSFAPSLTRARHTGSQGGGAQARALSDGVNGFPSRLRSSAHRPVTLRACLSLSLLSPPLDRQQRPAPAAAPRGPEGSGSQQPLLHQGGRAALGAFMPQNKAIPVLLALQRAKACA
jgi:hypothetical protein